MKLINTDGMAFIGPGSEWFWTALSGIVLAVTFIAIYRQLRLQRSQAAIEQIDAFEREWATERMCRIRLSSLIAYRDASDPADLGYRVDRSDRRSTGRRSHPSSGAATSIESCSGTSAASTAQLGG